jgi:hypothetical protein
VKNQLMAVDVNTSPEFRAGQPRPLFALPSASNINLVQVAMNEGWDISPDGKRFLVITALDKPETGVTLQAVVNWFEELRRLVPTEGK